MDTIQLTGIRAYGYTGYFQEERTLGQWFEVNLTLWMDLSKAGQSDRLEDTYNYCDAVKAAQELIKTSKFLLIERLVEAIAEVFLQEEQVEQVQVKLTKVSPPIPDFTGQVSVEILRSRNRVLSSNTSSLSL
ncbi:dihydroneopterin aldolase [Oscillatoria sp. FACHB-1407]|uniref:dihydroneopterin aldolase n=1 Tax=Oscillatoria sp. FACHB-1407 TaxID=2692847 RepID=UPI0016874217|nr:dihydroneopterin aldolase [Oscillatoria sp. FACHB-1407]MBD2464860.1 dihydroneopterin aldolase [Oscillatoria sp. FACHB-1407]